MRTDILIRIVELQRMAEAYVTGGGWTYADWLHADELAEIISDDVEDLTPLEVVVSALTEAVDRAAR